MDITVEWFIKTFKTIAEEYGNSEGIEAVTIVTEEGTTVISFSIDCGRYGIHRNNQIVIMQQQVRMDLSDIIEGGDLEWHLEKAIEKKLEIVVKSSVKDLASKNRTIDEIISSLETKDLVLIAQEIHQDVIPWNSLSRKIAAEVFFCEADETTLMQLISLAPTLALELSKRITL